MEGTKKSHLQNIFLFSLLVLLFTACEPKDVEEEDLGAGDKPTTEETEPKINELEYRELKISQKTSEDVKVQLDSYQFETIDPEEIEVVITDPSNGLIEEKENLFYYDGFLNFNGEDEVILEYKHKEEIILKEIYTITVIPVNDPPMPVDDNYSFQAGSDVELDVLGNDVDPDQDELTISNVNYNAMVGKISIINNKLKVDSDENYSGKFEFTYTVKDKENVEEDAKVTLNISPKAAAPDNSSKIPVRIVFINKDDGSNSIQDKNEYANRILKHLNGKFRIDEDVVASFYLDSIDNIDKTSWYTIPRSVLSQSLREMRTNHAINKKMNIFINNIIETGVAGVAYVNNQTYTTSLFESTMRTIALENNVVTHEIGHNFGIRHVAQAQENPRMVGYNGCGFSTSYYQHNVANYPPPTIEVNGWKVDTNLLYPFAINDDRYTPFTKGYKEVFSDIIRCWQNSALGFNLK